MSEGKLMMLWWAIFGKPEIEQRRDAATAFGVPFEEAKFWPAGMNWMRELLPSGKELRIHDRMICPELFSSKAGDVVPVFVDGQFAYHYFVRGFSWACGSDHIISPREFHIEFARRAALNPESTPTPTEREV
jgi:hypothetical protein